MRPQNEWFKPEKLTTYYFAYEGIFLAIVLGVVGVFAVTGILAAMELWTLVVGGTIFLVVFGYVTWWIPAFYRSADYRFTDDEIDYRRGVFFQQKTTIPYNRITNVGTAQGPVERLVDVGSVGIHTAGYGGQVGAELTISGVSDYEAIKDQILDHVRGRPPEATAGADVDVADIRAPPAGAGDDAAMLAELRAIRELLEQGRSA